MDVKRVSVGERALARQTIDLLDAVFVEQASDAGDEYLDRAPA